MANVNDTIDYLLKGQSNTSTSSGRVPVTGRSMTQTIDSMSNKKRRDTAQRKNINSFLNKSRDKLTYRDMLKGISLMDDEEEATKLYQDLKTLRRDPNSQFYNAYAGPTNKAAAALAEYGFDTSNINDDWFKENSWLTDYYRTTTYTNNVATPTKRSSKAEKAAYQYYQLTLAEEDTKKAEAEWDSLSKYLSYWASQSDRNYSDDEIIDRIDWKKYPTLTKMKELAAKGTPMELNRGIDFSDDAMYGVMWAAKNPGYTGSADGAMANSALGYGKTWHQNDRIASKLNPLSKDYSPYSVGSTMDKEREYFGVSYFDKDWVEKNKGLLTSGSEEDRKNYIAVAEAEQTTLAAEKELADLYAKIDKRLGRTKNPEDATKMLDALLESGDYPTLVKMDKSIDQGYFTQDKTTLGLTRAVNYRKADMLAYINDRISESTAQDELNHTEGIAEAAAGGVEFVQPKEPLPETIIEGTASLDDIQNYADSLLEDTEKPSSGASVPKDYLFASSDGTMPSPGDKKAPGNILEEKRRKAFDEKHGEGEYDRVMALARGETPDAISGAQPVSQMTEQEAAVYRQQDQTLAEGLDMTDGMLTPVEEEYMTNAGSIFTDYSTNLMTSLMDGGTRVARNLAIAFTPAVRQNHAGAVLGSLQSVYDYEKNEENLGLLRSQEGDLLQQLEGKEYIGQKRQDTETVQIERDGRHFEAILGWDNWNKTYTLKAIDELTAGGDRFGVSDPDDWAMLRDSTDINEFIQEANDKAAKIEEQNREGSYTEDDLRAAEKLRGIQLQIEDAEGYKAEHQEEYETSRDEFDEDQKAFRETLRVYESLGLDTDELEKAETAIGYLTQFHDYEATLWNGYNPSQMYADAIASGEDKADVLAAAKQGDKELQGELELAQEIKAYIEDSGITVPDDYMNNLDRHIAKLERDHEDYEYFALSGRDDFEETVRKGREMEYESRPQTQIMFGLIHNDRNDWDMDTYYAYQENGVYDELGQFDDHGLKGLLGGMNSLMTKDELDTYYYLLGSGDQQAAMDYVNFMIDMSYGVLWTRKRQQTEATAKGLTDQGLGGFLASNAMAVILNPVASIAAAGYFAYNLITGDELNPDNGLLSFSHFRNVTREESAQTILRELGDKNADGSYRENWKTKLAQAGYEMVTNRLDSTANGLVFGGLFGEGGASFLSKALHETGSAIPMGINAAMDAAAEAKRKGASDAQAYGIAAITAVCETVTEGFSYENMNAARLIGEEITAGTVKEFLVNWLTEAGISEMAGESITEIIENYADEKIMGKLSNHNDRVWDYRLKGMSPEEAEAAARRDELNGVLRTALISYLSPGLDIVQTGAGRYEYYRSLTQQHQEAGDNRSMLEIMRGEKKARKDLENAGAVLDGSKSQSQLVAGYEILESAKNGSTSTKTASLAAALNGVFEQRGTSSKAIADAAAVRLGRIFGRNAVGKTQELVTGAAVGGVDANRLTQALQNAALSDKSEAAKVMKGRAYKNATPDVKAAMLAATVDADAKNPNVMNDIVKNVRENKVNAEMKAQIAGGALNSVRPAVTEARNASREARVAESQLEDRQEERKAAQDAITTANEAVQQNPQEGAAVMAEALNKLNSTTAVEQEYIQKAETAQRKEKEAKENASRVVNEGLAQVRQESQARVAEQEAQEAEAAQEAEVQAQQQAIEAQAAQEAQEASDNALDADIDVFIEDNYADATDEEKQHIRELFAKNRSTESTPDADRAKFLGQVSRKFGVNIVEADQTDLNANGYYDSKTNTITLNKNATTGDALYFVLGHELTHMTEQAGEYNKLADSILRVAFGEGTTYQGILRDMQAGRANSPLARMVDARRAQYEQTTGQSYGNDYYLQEIVADNLGLMLRGDPNNPGMQQDLINRLVADNPTTARKILDGIKTFLKRAVGMRGAWQTDMQNTVDLFNQALSNAQANRQQAEQTQPTTPQDAVQRATETGEAQPLPDRQGKETSADVLRGNTVVLDTTKLSLNSFNEAEQERTRAALLSMRDENGNRLYHPQQVDKYMWDIMGIASMIAADRGRLDFEATDNPLMSFLKKNQDYGFTLDASTLCAKRLLYQGTFNYVQHALPNEVFTPRDLIDLVNIMNEMGYETPCGICYVESRRRWLDTYANEFISKITENPEAFIQKQFEKAPDEEKAALRERFAGDKPSIDDLTTTDGLENLRKNDPYMYKAFVTAMNAKGSANPKVVQPRTEYKGEIAGLTDKQIQDLKDIGGLRVQSFSDFETPHLLDMIQAVYDMAARGLTSQAYTKVPNFAWVFGDTGIKINLSLIGKGTGVDDNGNLMFDNKEGMNFDEAMKLRNRYSKNVGTILVGINDEHIIAAMADPRIDFIIPFHKSGWSDTELKGISSLQYYKDYTASQNERKLFKDKNGNYVKNEDGSYKTIPAKQSKIKNFEPVGAHKYWDFSQSGEWNARHYLEMCAKDGRIPKFNQFLVDNGDGSFSLPEGDDKRSTAIREGYWKTLIDFKMYDNDGNRADQTAVTPNVNMDQARRVMNEYTLSRPSGNANTKMVDMRSNNDVPVATTAAEEYIRRIREKRGMPPVEPDKSLHAIPEIDVMGLPERQLDTGEEAPAMMGTAAMASGAETELGNTPTTNTEEPTQAAAQMRMAVDAETGESRRLSLTNANTVADQLYAAAVERGEEDEAANYVIEAAQEAGYTETAYHGTDTFGFTQVDMDASQDSIFVAYNKGTAKTYTGEDAEVRDVATSSRNELSKMSDDQLAEFFTKTIHPGFKYEGDPFMSLTKSESNPGMFELEGRITVTELTREDVIRLAEKEIFYQPTNGVYEFFVRPGNQLVVDAEGEDWNSIPFDLYGAKTSTNWDFSEGDTEYTDTDWDENFDPDRDPFHATTREIAKWAKAHGYDSVRINNVYDHGGRSGSFNDGYGDIGIFFNPEDVKAADTVTYDDQDNVIPLSERFNAQQDDIRYQLPDDSVLERQIKEYLAGGGSLNRQTRPSPDRPQKERQYGSRRAENIPLWHDETIKHLKENSKYYVDSNQEQVDRAFNWIQSHATENDPTGYYGAVQELESEDFNFATADGQARMIVTAAMAAVKANNGDPGALNDERRLNDAFDRQGTSIAQAFQARQIYFLLTPQAKEHKFQRVIDQINADYKRKGKKTRVALPQNLMDDLKNAKTDGELDKALDAARKNIASQMPANWKEKMQAWRMTAMLLNTKTHAKNILGNLVFMPAVGIKNKIGALGEIVTHQETRTKTLGFASPEARAFANQDKKKVEHDLRGDKKYSEGNKIQQERKMFGQGDGLISKTLGKGVQKLMDANGNALEWEDWIFLQRHYRNALAGYMTANKLTAKDMKGKTLNEARAYAIKEAQKATYRDANEIADWMNNLKNPVGRFVVNAALPFKKTPMNILKRGVEYSPAGLLYSAVKGMKQIKSGKMTVNEYIDKISAGLTGTGIMVLGALLSGIGAASAGLDDDDDEFAKLRGEQEYAINPGKVGNAILSKFGVPKLFGEDVSYTIDWAAPASMPFFVGAAIMDTYKNQPKLSIPGVLDALFGITEPVFNLSMLEGVNSLLDVSQYAEGNAFTQVGEKLIANYASSYVPSFVGAATRTFFDNTRRKSYVESGADMSIFRYALEGLENKLPYLSTTNIPYRDVWGNAETSGLLERLLENFVSPGYANQLKDDPVVNELERLYRETGDKTMIPKAAGKTIGKEKLNAKQQDQYVVSRGQTARQVLEDLMESPFWGISDDPTRAKMVNDAWTYANQVGQNTVTGKKMDAWVFESSTKGNVVETIASRAADNNKKAYIAGYGQMLAEALDSDTREDYDVALAALESAKATNTQVKGALRDYFRPLYQAAYKQGGEAGSERMKEIERMLQSTGYGFDEDKDFAKWIYGGDKEEEIDTSWLSTTP